MNTLDMQSPNWANINTDRIAELFPNCVTETAEGKKIDFDLLKQELSTDIIEGTKERYRLEWPGKREAIVTANIPTTKTLRPVREDSVDFDTTENLYIEGDNLEVLKLLQESYLGKIKMIYIDPPYNTGSDFVYKDNFAKAGEEELVESGQKDEYNQKLVANPETSGRYHSDWLTMMYPRLKLARNLLTEDGVIFISIDDNEVHNLRKIGDEVFGERNFVANIIWQKRYTRSNNTDGFTSVIEHILVYSRNDNFKPNLLPRSNEADNRYTNPDNDPRGPWKAMPFFSQATPSQRPNLSYDIIHPKTKQVILPKEKAWRSSKEVYEQYEKNNLVWWGKDLNSQYPSIKRFLSEAREGMTPINFLDYQTSGSTDDANKDIKELFDIKIFDTPKPIKLIKSLLDIGSDKNSLVLDFYSGSATTAHAVINQNYIDNGSRKFILVQLPEKIDEKSEAYKAGYHNICEIGKERIRRAAKKIKEEKEEKAKKEGLFADFKDEQDYGFRVYRLDSSNMQDVYYKPQDYNQTALDLFADNVKPDRSAEDLLTQIMLDWGLPLSLKIERKIIAGKEVFSVAGDSLYACFDEDLDETFAKAVAIEKPLRIVFRDRSFRDDTAKENVRQLLKQLSPQTEMRVV